MHAVDGRENIKHSLEFDPLETVRVKISDLQNPHLLCCYGVHRVLRRAHLGMVMDGLSAAIIRPGGSVAVLVTTTNSTGLVNDLTSTTN